MEWSLILISTLCGAVQGTLLNCFGSLFMNMIVASVLFISAQLLLDLNGYTKFY